MTDAFHRIYVSSNGDGSATVHNVTNDDNDDGYDDGEVVDWTETWPTVAKALKHAGASRVGISGVVVTVMFDGEELTSDRYSEVIASFA